MIDWRALFDNIRVPWKDRGPNTSAGNVNICCPSCKDDYGYHLSISEERDAFFCFRNPSNHSGSNVRNLLTKLGVSWDETSRLLNRFRLSGQRKTARPELQTVKRRGATAASLWERFIPAGNVPTVARYLVSRGYSDPIYTSLRYDLRAAISGRWACRLLFPVTIDGTVRTWTGRAAIPGLEPRYDVETDKTEGLPLVYVPDETAFIHSSIGVIVEGPADALRIASAGVPRIVPLALMGTSTPEIKLLRMRKLLRSCSSVHLALDNSVPIGQVSSFLSLLRSLSLLGPVKRLRLPELFKDAGEMSQTEAQEWLENVR